MVIAAFPIAKLGALLVKQLSKPIANYAKERAKHHPFFRKYICMPPAQIYNWCEVKMKMWVLNLGKPVNVPSLNEQMAIELGANLLGETIIFTMAAGILLAEYSRQVRKEAAKETKRREEFEDMCNRLDELYFQTQQQRAQIYELTRSLYEIETKVNKKPSKPPPPPPPPPPFPSHTHLTKPSPNVNVSGNPSGSENVVNSNTSALENDANLGLISKALQYISTDVLALSAINEYHYPLHSQKS